MLQVWLFIAPGLYSNEKRLAIPFVLSTAGLFIMGGLFAYFVAFRYGLAFLLGIGISNGVQPLVTITHYFDLFVNVMLGVALVFELPVAIFFLTLLHLASPRFLMRHSRYAILAIVILAAVITPASQLFVRSHLPPPESRILSDRDAWLLQTAGLKVRDIPYRGDPLVITDLLGGQIDVAALVKRYRGSLSGEHGDGRLRGEFIRTMVGPDCYRLLERVKSVAPSPRGLRIQGVDGLMVRYAACCQPVPGDKVVGYVTRGRGVSIHRRNCNTFMQLSSRAPERVIQTEWGKRSDAVYPVDIQVEAASLQPDRDALRQKVGLPETLSEGDRAQVKVGQRTRPGRVEHIRARDRGLDLLARRGGVRGEPRFLVAIEVDLLDHELGGLLHARDHGVPVLIELRRVQGYVTVNQHQPIRSCWAWTRFKSASAPASM